MSEETKKEYSAEFLSALLYQNSFTIASMGWVRDESDFNNARHIAGSVLALVKSVHNQKPEQFGEILQKTLEEFDDATYENMKEKTAKVRKIDNEQNS